MDESVRALPPVEALFLIFTARFEDVASTLREPKLSDMGDTVIFGGRVKAAVTFLSAVIETVQRLSETESQPVHPLKNDLLAAVAVMVTLAPPGYVPVQVFPEQVRPLAVTVPCLFPPLVTVS